MALGIYSIILFLIFNMNRHLLLLMYSRRQVEIRAAREKSLEASKLKDWSGIARTLKHDCKKREIDKADARIVAVADDLTHIFTVPGRHDIFQFYSVNVFFT